MPKRNMDGRLRDSQRKKVLAAIDDLRSDAAAAPFNRPLQRQQYLTHVRSLISDQWWVEHRKALNLESASVVARLYGWPFQYGFTNPSTQSYAVATQSYAVARQFGRNGSIIEFNALKPDLFDLYRLVAQTIIPVDAAYHGPEFTDAFIDTMEFHCGLGALATQHFERHAVMLLRDRVEQQQAERTQVEQQYAAMPDSLAKLLADLRDLA